MNRFKSVAFAAVTVFSLAFGAVVPAQAATGPYLVKDINATGSSSPSDMTVMNGILYFAARGGGKGNELWRSDGTANGTYRVKDIKTGSGSSWPYGFRAIGSLLYFAA